MKQEEQIRVVEGLMSHLDNDTNVDAGCQLRNPVSAYTDPDIAAREWSTFFQGHPQVLGLYKKVIYYKQEWMAWIRCLSG